MSGRHGAAPIAFAAEGSRRHVGMRAAALLGATGLTAAGGTATAIVAVLPGGVSVPEGATVSLFLVCFAWIAFAFWTAVTGFVHLLARRPVSGLAGPVSTADALAISSRVALVVPVRDEDPHALAANLRAIGESIGRTRHSASIDLFILSDTVDPDILVAEELAWTELRGTLAGTCEVFYRRRTDNGGKKAGNLAEFCCRWGAAYDYFLVLDADSLMEADTIVAMTRIMELNPGVGILQAPPQAVGGRTRFARLQQFAGFAYGALVTAGMSSWQGGSSNYWGHNAIIRTAAFARYCGLPVLSGSGPFSGEILSHDFVEAALMRRAGYEVWMLPSLTGSYERLPPTLLDYARRDRRWAAGNVQHLRLLGTSGLHPLSRMHLFVGAMSYLVSPLWLLFIAAGAVVALNDSATPGTREVDAVLAAVVLASSTILVVAPRILGVVLIVRDRDLRRALGGVASVLASGLVEIAVSAVMAPVTMVLQTIALAGILTGARTSWGAQRRHRDALSVSELLGIHWPHLLLGAMLTVTAAVVPGTAPWLALMILSLLGSPFLTAWTSGIAPDGSPLSRLLTVPEETAPSRVFTRADELQRRADARPEDGLRRVLLEGRAHAVHLTILDTVDGDHPRVPARVQRLVMEREWDRITPAERALALGSATFLRDARGRLTASAPALVPARRQPIIVG